MTTLIFHHDLNQLPSPSDNIFPVQMYNLEGQNHGGISLIGSPIIEKIKRLGVNLTAQVMDFLSIALAVTAADTFVLRKDSPDGWTRTIKIQLPLYEPHRWESIKHKLVSAFHFLSGDIWEFDFIKGGYPPPTPYHTRDRYHLIDLKGLDCVCLFSGGLDSAIGVIDLVTKGHSPLLVSHAYKGDKTHQDKIVGSLPGKYSRFAINAHPVSANHETEITMRTRSCNFLAMGVLGAFAIQEINHLGPRPVELIVPENGFISLNAPLTMRRIGSLSTRTTHPHFIESIQNIFDAMEMSCEIKNPYQFKTKGEMVSECQNETVLASIIDNTVSCSHWKRTNQQCGVCVPCIIRRSALHASGLTEETEYSFNNLADVLKETDKRDDLLALAIAVTQKETRKPGPWISDSGPLSPEKYQEFQNVFINGLNEVAMFLRSEGVL